MNILAHDHKRHLITVPFIHHLLLLEFPWTPIMT